MFCTLSGEIEADCPFFPFLHRIFASRPNVTPIVLTTGVGPHGTKTVWHQPPPVLPSEDQPPSLSVSLPSPERAFGDDSTAALNVQPPVTPPRAPKPSSMAHESVAKSQKPISKLPQKRSLGDTLLEIQKYVSFLYLLKGC